MLGWSEECGEIKLEDMEVLKAKCFMYFGSTVQEDGNAEEEVTKRMTV